jgi:hypothetical protein
VVKMEDPDITHQGGQELVAIYFNSFMEFSAIQRVLPTKNAGSILCKTGLRATDNNAYSR